MEEIKTQLVFKKWTIKNANAYNMFAGRIHLDSRTLLWNTNQQEDKSQTACWRDFWTVIFIPERATRLSPWQQDNDDDDDDDDDGGDDVFFAARTEFLNII
jgi:hypothetical protein